MILRYSEGRRIRSSFVSLNPLGSDRQAFAASRPSPLKDGSATLGPHPNAETVCSFARSVARLKCSFHVGSLTYGLISKLLM